MTINDNQLVEYSREYELYTERLYNNVQFINTSVNITVLDDDSKWTQELQTYILTSNGIKCANRRKYKIPE